MFLLQCGNCWGVDIGRNTGVRKTEDRNKRVAAGFGLHINVHKSVRKDYSMVQFETFEHEADIGIRGFGGSMKEAFENVAVALYSVMVNIDAVNALEERTVTVSAPDRELLLVEWLNALLAISDIEHMIFTKFDVKIEGTTLTGVAWGEALDRDRHEPHVEVKGATYHMLSVKEQDGKYTAQCVVDV